MQNAKKQRVYGVRSVIADTKKILPYLQGQISAVKSFASRWNIIDEQRPTDAPSFTECELVITRQQFNEEFDHDLYRRLATLPSEKTRAPLHSPPLDSQTTDLVRLPLAKAKRELATASLQEVEELNALPPNAFIAHIFAKYSVRLMPERVDREYESVRSELKQLHKHVCGQLAQSYPTDLPQLAAEVDRSVQLSLRCTKLAYKARHHAAFLSSCLEAIDCQEVAARHTRTLARLKQVRDVARELRSQRDNLRHVSAITSEGEPSTEKYIQVMECVLGVDSLRRGGHHSAVVNSLHGEANALASSFRRRLLSKYERAMVALASDLPQLPSLIASITATEKAARALSAKYASPAQDLRLALSEDATCFFSTVERLNRQVPHVLTPAYEHALTSAYQGRAMQRKDDNELL